MYSKKIEAKPFSSALAIWSALFMLFLGILANFGIYTEAAEQMSKWHMFFSTSVAGIVGGMIEAAIVSFIGAYSFIYIYNLFVKD